jgi:hypothetical protein
MDENKFGPYVKKIGDVYYPMGRPRLRTDDLFQEPTWEVRREGSRYLFEFLAARQGGGTDTHEITQEEFEAVKAEQMLFEDLLRKYDR